METKQTKTKQKMTPSLCPLKNVLIGEKSLTMHLNVRNLLNSRTSCSDRDTSFTHNPPRTTRTNSQVRIPPLTNAMTFSLGKRSISQRKETPDRVKLHNYITTDRGLLPPSLKKMKTNVSISLPSMDSSFHVPIAHQKGKESTFTSCKTTLPPHRVKMRDALVEALQQSLANKKNTSPSTQTNEEGTAACEQNLSSTKKTSNDQEPRTREQNESIAEYFSYEIIELRATEIEHELQKLPSSRIMSQFRTIHFNLNDSKNDELRSAVLCRRLAADQLVQMSGTELANPDLRSLRETDEKTFLERIDTKNHKAGTPTTFFTCHQCHKNKTTFFELQTSSADEPSTKFVTCLTCGFAWKFR